MDSEQSGSINRRKLNAQRSSVPFDIKPDKCCLENKCLNIFSATTPSHNPDESLAGALLHKRLSLWLRPCQHVSPLREGGGRNHFDPLWSMSSLSVQSQFTVEGQRLVNAICGKALSHLKSNKKKKKGKYYHKCGDSRLRYAKRWYERKNWWQHYRHYPSDKTKCRDTGQSRLQPQIWL